jgi:hypothetical protein
MSFEKLFSLALAANLDLHMFTAECNSESCPCQEDQEGASFVKQVCDPPWPFTSIASQATEAFQQWDLSRGWTLTSVSNEGASAPFKRLDS